MFDLILKDIASTIEGAVNVPVFIDEAEQSNQPFPFIIISIIPASTVIERAGQNNTVPKLGDLMFNFQFGVDIFNANDSGHHWLYEMAQNIFKVLDYKFLKNINSCQTWNLIYGDPYWDEHGTAIFASVYGCFGSLKDSGDK
jgi:hypothetical protein